jgi:AcrR family transcriptional regulator
MVGLPTRDRRAERREATRQEILAAAWDIVHEAGLANLTLREIAIRVGMQPPSLYTHFASKNAVYDAMFEQGWRTALELFQDRAPSLPTDPRARLLSIALTYFDFAVQDLARHQIMDVRTLPDFAPSERAYRPAREGYEKMRELLNGVGIRRQADFDVYTALIAGFVSQQLANDPGGGRWRRLLPRAIDMYANDLGLPGPLTKKSTRRTP